MYIHISLSLSLYIEIHCPNCGVYFYARPLLWGISKLWGIYKYLTILTIPQESSEANSSRNHICPHSCFTCILYTVAFFGPVLNSHLVVVATGLKPHNCINSLKIYIYLYTSLWCITLLPHCYLPYRDPHNWCNVYLYRNIYTYSSRPNMGIRDVNMVVGFCQFQLYWIVTL